MKTQGQTTKNMPFSWNTRKLGIIIEPDSPNPSFRPSISKSGVMEHIEAWEKYTKKSSKDIQNSPSSLFSAGMEPFGTSASSLLL